MSEGEPRGSQKWAESLENLISHECGLAAFKAFLKSEYSEENIDFWISCEEYKKIKSPSKLSPRAKKIYNEFISVQATKEVNLILAPGRRQAGTCWSPR